MSRDRRGEPERELAYRGARPLDVGEAERGEPLLGGLGRQRAGVPASASSSGAKNSRSWIDRTAAWCARWSASNAASASPRASSR